MQPLLCKIPGMNSSLSASTIASIVLLLSLHVGAGKVQAASVQNVQLTSLHWPPYSGSDLARRGATSAVVSAAMASMGYRLEISFYPWTRATVLARTRSRFIGYFPEYMSKESSSACLLSDSIGASPLGLAERVDARIHWSSLDDLARFQVGVVTGYINSQQFDERVRKGRQRVDFASSDKQNLLKLAARRVPVAVIDRRVFHYLSRHDQQVAAVAHKLRFNARLLENKHLYVCFRRTPEGEQMGKC